MPDCMQFAHMLFADMLFVGCDMRTCAAGDAEDEAIGRSYKVCISHQWMALQSFSSLFRAIAVFSRPPAPVF